MTDAAIQSDSFVPPPPPRWSAVAITGFVFSFLFVLAPIGIVLGIVGIFRTLRGRRKGMGLAVAAIPIGLAMSAASIFFVMAIVFGVRAMAAGPMVAKCFEGSKAAIPELSGAVHQRCSQAFRDKVSREEFAAWATRVVEKHGSLQSTERPRNPITPSDDGITVHLTGKFVNGPATLSIRVTMNGLTPQIEDVEVDGVSPIAKAGD